MNLSATTILSATMLVAGAAPAQVEAQTAGLAGIGATSPEDIAFANRLSNAFKSVASLAEPAVVHIVSLRKVQQVRRDWFGAPIEIGPERLQPAGLGSGFIVGADGVVVSNNHVIADADQLKVKLADGREFDASVVGRDEATDLAVLRLKLDGQPLGITPLSFGDSETLDVGEWVVAIGSPFGFSSTVTAGIVSAKGRALTPRETGRSYEDFIQTDAAINPGNSGGPLLNLRGQVVGINTAIASRTGGNEGLGFAIPSVVARTAIDNILANGRLVRGWMGVDLADAPASDAKGVIVRHVVEGSPAEQAGLKEGDLITRFQGQNVNESRLRTAIAVSRPGTNADIELLREGKPLKLAVKVGDQVAALAEIAAAQGNEYVDNLGISVKTYTREMARDASYPAWVKGVVVQEVQPNSVADRSGLKPGDILVQVGRSRIVGAKEFASMAAEFSGGEVLGVVRGQNRGEIILQR